MLTLLELLLVAGIVLLLAEAEAGGEAVSVVGIDATWLLLLLLARLVASLGIGSIEVVEAFFVFIFSILFSTEGSSSSVATATICVAFFVSPVFSS